MPKDNAGKLEQQNDNTNENAIVVKEEQQISDFNQYIPYYSTHFQSKEQKIFIHGRASDYCYIQTAEPLTHLGFTLEEAFTKLVEIIDSYNTVLIVTDNEDDIAQNLLLELHKLKEQLLANKNNIVV